MCRSLLWLCWCCRCADHYCGCWCCRCADHYCSCWCCRCANHYCGCWCCRCANHYCGCVGVAGMQIITVAVLVLQVCRSHRGPRVQTLTATRPSGRPPNCPPRRCPSSDLSTKRFVHKATVVLSLEKGAYPEKSPVLYCQTEFSIPFVFDVFGSCLRTLAVLLVSNCFCV